MQASVKASIVDLKNKVGTLPGLEQKLETKIRDENEALVEMM
jgi:hypothetical protein